ncbi:hypothetical protein [Chitinophaga rhizosphaerae]|nr:hypothetical protein [Chitinophaga rhizosphaerae]
MEKKITITTTNAKALAFLDKLHEKKQQIKEQMRNSPLAQKTAPKVKPQ